MWEQAWDPCRRVVFSLFLIASLRVLADLSATKLVLMKVEFDLPKIPVHVSSACWLLCGWRGQRTPRWERGQDARALVLAGGAGFVLADGSRDVLGLFEGTASDSDAGPMDWILAANVL